MTVCAGGAFAQDDAQNPTGLSLEQESLASRFERLEAVAARLAELADNSEPERAEQLRRTIKASREKGVAERFDDIVKLLKEEKLAAAARDQVALQTELENLLQVLLEDPGDAERDAMKRFLKDQIREIGKLIRQQRSLHAQNLDGASEERLAEEQQKVGDDTEQVEKNLKEGSEQHSAVESSESPSQESQPNEGKSEDGQPSEGQPSEGQPQRGQPQDGPPPPGEPSSDPIERAAKRVEAARKAMQQAEEKLRDAEREGAAEDQRQAQRELEAARAELERILRQLREEEMQRLLAKLAGRFREMLASQRSIHDDTVALAQETDADASRNRLLKSIRLSRREGELVRDAEKALEMLREDGTSVAFPETAEQIAGDMRSVTKRLTEGDVGPITQTVELDIIAGLEEMIAALDMARDELAQQQGQPQQGQGGGGEPGESPLVSKLAELRMIRTLQARIYKRTQDLGALAENPQIDQQDLRGEVETLSRRQQRVFEATRDLHTGANQ